MVYYSLLIGDEVCKFGGEFFWECKVYYELIGWIDYVIFFVNIFKFRGFVCWMRLKFVCFVFNLIILIL